MTKLWTTRDEPAPEQLRDIAAALERGEVLLLPTDTIYGLHAAATDERAVARIAAVKGRDEGKPFVVIGESAGQLESIGVRFDASVRQALDALWPAPLTAILPLVAPIAASRGALTAAVRVPDLPWLRRLLHETGPLASTSANRSGEPPVSSPADLAPELQERIDGIVDSGPLSGEPSAIVDFTGAEPRLVREASVFFTQEVWKRLWKTL
jgi:tRNA threonylcarbamoyl adenosine modification protein (Sua5/YciO/YrdC/YwlC family)